MIIEELWLIVCVICIHVKYNVNWDEMYGGNDTNDIEITINVLWLVEGCHLPNVRQWIESQLS